MDDITDKQLMRVRLRFLDLLKSFFTEEPDAERMSRWRGTFAALAREQISPSIDKAVRRLSQLLAEMSLQDLQEEFYQLFVNPFGEGIIASTASYYKDGRNYGQSLADLRGFLQEANLEKDTKYTDSEDSLVIMLDALATFVAEEQNVPGTAYDKQAILLENYLEPFSVQFSKALQEDERAHFFAACGDFLTSYLELEKGLTSEN